MSFSTGTIKELKIFSESLQEEITLLVYLPASFSPLYKYSLLIAQDGRDYYQLGRIGRIADELLSNKEIENIIIVGIPYRSVEDRRKKYHPNGEQQQAYIRFLAHELVPFLDQEFPTYQMGMGRTLIGDSLGATVSLMAALHYPHTFGKIILQSPFVNQTVIDSVETSKNSSMLSIYHVVGTKETEVQTSEGKVEDFLTPNKELARLLSEKGFEYIFEEFNGGHTWTYWQPNLKTALKKMF